MTSQKDINANHRLNMISDIVLEIQEKRWFYILFKRMISYSRGTLSINSTHSFVLAGLSSMSILCPFVEWFWLEVSSVPIWSWGSSRKFQVSHKSVSGPESNTLESKDLSNQNIRTFTSHFSIDGLTSVVFSIY